MNWLAFRPDGKQLAYAIHNGPDRVGVRDVETGTVVALHRGHTNHAIWVAWSPDGKRLYSSGYDLAIQVWDAEAGKLLQPFHFPEATGYVRAALRPDGRQLTAGDLHGRLWRVDLDRHQVIPLPHSGWNRIHDLAYRPRGRWLAISGGPRGPWDSQPHATTVWDRATGAVRYRIPDDHPPAAFSPDGRRLLTGGRNNSLHVYPLPEE